MYKLTHFDPETKFLFSAWPNLFNRVVRCLTLRSPVRAEGVSGGWGESGRLSLLTRLPQSVFITAAWEQGAVISPALSFRYSGTTKDWNTVLNQMKQAIVLLVPAMNEPSDYVGMEGK